MLVFIFVYVIVQGQCIPKQVPSEKHVFVSENAYFIFTIVALKLRRASVRSDRRHGAAIPRICKYLIAGVRCKDQATSAGGYNYCGEHSCAWQDCTEKVCDVGIRLCQSHVLPGPCHRCEDGAAEAIWCMRDFGISRNRKKLLPVRLCELCVASDMTGTAQEHMLHLSPGAKAVVEIRSVVDRCSNVVFQDDKH